MKAGLLAVGVLVVAAVGVGALVVVGSDDSEQSAEIATTAGGTPVFRTPDGPAFGVVPADAARAEPRVTGRPEAGDARPEAEDGRAEARREDDRRDRGGRDWRARMDTDGDGIVSEAEFAAGYAVMQARREEWRQREIERFDLDGDGEVSDAERRAAWEERRAEMRLRRYDADGDGVLNEAEQARADEDEARRQAERDERLLGEWDLDGDGAISDAERQAAREDQMQRAANQRQSFVSQFDRDGDGTLNVDESYDAFSTMTEARDQQRFVREYDSDGDGTLSVFDLDSYMQRFNAGDMSSDANGDGALTPADIELFRDRMMADTPDIQMPQWGRDRGGRGDRQRDAPRDQAGGGTSTDRPADRAP